MPEGFKAVDWRVDPETSPSRDTTMLQLLVTERECVGGQAMGDRLNCPGNPESALVVHLPEPLGDREIIEGLAIGISLEDYLP